MSVHNADNLPIFFSVTTETTPLALFIAIIIIVVTIITGIIAYVVRIRRNSGRYDITGISWWKMMTIHEHWFFQSYCTHCISIAHPIRLFIFSIFFFSTLIYLQVCSSKILLYWYIWISLYACLQYAFIRLFVLFDHAYILATCQLGCYS